MQFFYNNVVFLRHGETKWNVQNRMQGQVDSLLTETGIAQAKKVAEKLANHQFDAIISSPLSRALETAKIIAERLNISEITTDDLLMERNLGALQGMTVEESKSTFSYLWDTNGKFIFDGIIPNAESLETFLSRVSKSMEKINEVSKTKSVLVVTHDGVLHAMVSRKKGIAFSEVGERYRFKHCDPIVLN